MAQDYLLMAKNLRFKACAGPTTEGGFIQWSQVAGELRRPADVEARDQQARQLLQQSKTYTTVRLVTRSLDSGSSPFD